MSSCFKEDSSTYTMTESIDNNELGKKTQPPKKLKVIENTGTRYNVKHKKMKVIVKKTHELAVKCGLKINFTVYDPTINKLTEYKTDDDFDLEGIRAMIKKDIEY